MIMVTELILTIQLVVIAAGLMILGKAIREKIIWNKIAGGVLLVGGLVFFACSMCHMVKYHKHHKHGFSRHHGKCEYKCKKYKDKLENCDGEECDRYKRKTERWCEKDDD